MIIGWQKSQKMENQTPPGLQNVDAKVGHEHHKRTETCIKYKTCFCKRKQKEEEEGEV
jgi:hypothetical protein